MLNLKAGTSSSVTHCAIIRWMESGRRVSPLRINHSGSISLSIIRTNRSSYSHLEQRHERCKPMVKSIRAKRCLMEKRAGSRINDKFHACSTGNCEDGCVVCSFPSRKQPLISCILTFERSVQFAKQRYIEKTVVLNTLSLHFSKYFTKDWSWNIKRVYHQLNKIRTFDEYYRIDGSRLSRYQTSETDHRISEIETIVIVQQVNWSINSN